MYCHNTVVIARKIVNIIISWICFQKIMQILSKDIQFSCWSCNVCSCYNIAGRNDIKIKEYNCKETDMAELFTMSKASEREFVNSFAEF